MTALPTTAASYEKLRVVMKIMLSLILCLILAGCAAFTHLVATSSAPPRSSASEALQYYHNAQTLEPAALRRLYAQEQALLTQSNDPEDALRVALLLTIQKTPFHDNSRAAELLRAYAQQARHDDDLRALASLLLSTLSETQRQVTRYQQTKQALDGAMKEKSQLEHRYKWAKNRLAHAQQERSQHEQHYQEVHKALRQEKETVESLRNQIEQLKTIEKMLNKRKVKTNPAT